MASNLFICLLITISNIFDFYIFSIERWSRKDAKDIFSFTNVVIYVAFLGVAMRHDLFLFRIIFELLPDIQG